MNSNTINKQKSIFENEYFALFMILIILSLIKLYFIGVNYQ